MKKTLLFILSVVGLILSASGNAQEKPDSVRVLFIGNSFTHVNDVPKTVQQIAASQGMNMAYTQFTPGGYYLAGHVKNDDLIRTIKQGGWDYVVIQEQSAAPAMPTEVVLRNTYPAARTLDSLVLAYNRNAKVIFYMTWGHKDGCQEEVSDYPLIYTYNGMQDRLKISYLEMAYRNNAWCAPVGMAWQRVRNERPDYVLYAPDRSHPSPLGSYLASNVIFTTIYRQPYQTKEIMDFSPEQAEYIQQVAQQTVLGNLKLLNMEK